MKHLLKLSFILAVSLLASACATKGPNVVTESMPNDEYLQLSEKGKQEYHQGIKNRSLLEQKKRDEFMAGIPVYEGDDHTGRYAWFDKTLGVIHISHNSTTGAMGIDSHGDVMIVADQNGKIFYKEDVNGIVRPITLLANIATQQGWGRFLGQILGNIAAGMGNSLGLGLIRGSGCSGGGCGVPIVNNVSAGSIAGANAGANVDYNSKTGIPTK